MNQKRLEKLCRTCLKTSRNLLSFTKEIKIEQEELTISDFYIKVLNLSLNCLDHEKSKICTSCFEKLKEFYDFKTSAIVNDKFYRLFLTEPKENDPEELSDDEETKIKTEVAEVPVNDSLYLKEETIDIPDHNFTDSDSENEEFEENESNQEENTVDSEDFIEELESKEALENGTFENVELSPPKPTKRRTRKTKTERNFEDKVQCEHCKSWMYKETLPRHMKRLHKNVGKGKYTKDFKCTVPNCEKSFLTNWQLQYHLNVHSNTRMFKCRLCDLSYFRHFHLKRHMLEKHISESDVRFNCQLCSGKFKKKSLIANHYKKVHKELSRDELQKEIGKINSVCLEFLGEVPEEFLRKKNTITCPMCNDFECERASYLKRHIITAHLKLKVKCPLCSLGFTRKNQLKNHLILKHKDDEGGISRVAEAWDEVRDLQLSELAYNKDIPESVKDIIGRKRRNLEFK